MKAIILLQRILDLEGKMKKDMKNPTKKEEMKKMSKKSMSEELKKMKDKGMKKDCKY